MARNALFKSGAGWGKNLLPPEISHRVIDSAACSKYFDTSGAGSKRMSTVHQGIFKAITAYIDNKNGFGKYYGKVGVGIVNENYIAEYRHESGITSIASFNKSTKILEGANVALSGRYEPIDLNTASMETGDIFFLAMMPLLLEDDEAKTAFEAFELKYIANNLDYDANVMIALLCDNIYRRIESEVFVVKTPPTGDVRKISDAKVKTGMYTPDTIICGNFIIFAKGSPSPLPTGSGTAKVKDLRNRFKKFTEGRILTEEEQKLLEATTQRILEDDYVSPEVIEMAEYIVGSMNDKKPIVNFLWRGETGFGKSYGCEELAAILGLPLLRITCHPTMETLDFLNKFVPDTKTFDTSIYPSFEDIAYDPESAYKMLTGEEKEGVSSQEVLEIYLDIVSAKKSTTPKFKLVESDYVKALANGYILEIQEPSVVLNSGVLTGLNEYNRPGAIITLPDGTTRVRHKNSIVIMTDNVIYEGCRPMNQSVLRRNFLAIDSYKMSKGEIIERVKNMSGFEDDEILELMYETWQLIKDYCKAQSITDGTVSIEELGNWAQAVKIRGSKDLKTSCIRTVVSKATAMVDEQESIISTCVDVKLL